MKIVVVNKIVKHIGDVSVNERTGWTREFNLVSWNEGEPKYEVRAWSPEHDRCGKMGGLTKEEMKTVIELFKTETEDEQ